MMNDLIRRQDAIEVLTDTLTSSIMLDTLLLRMNSLPSAQLEPSWIPCSKELPPDDRTVLVTLKWGEDDREILVGEYWHDSPSSKGWGTFEGHVIAWMPLPEPYKDGN